MNRIKIESILMLVAALLSQFAVSCNNHNNEPMTKNTKMEKILFINGSPNRDGNTAALAKVLLEGREYETLNLND